MKHKLIIGMTVGMMLMTGCGGDVTPTPSPTPNAARQKQMEMDAAYERDENIFMWDANQMTPHALFYGGQRVVYIKSRVMRTVKLTSNECMNLELRKRVGDDWAFAYAFPTLSPGDYAYYDGASWRVTSYNPANAITQ